MKTLVDYCNEAIKATEEFHKQLKAVSEFCEPPKYVKFSELSLRDHFIPSDGVERIRTSYKDTFNAISVKGSTCTMEPNAEVILLEPVKPTQTALGNLKIGEFYITEGNRKVVYQKIKKADGSLDGSIISIRKQGEHMWLFYHVANLQVEVVTVDDFIKA